MICSLVSSSAQYQSDEGEQFEMEPMDTEFEESSLNRCVASYHYNFSFTQCLLTKVKAF